MPPKPAIWSDDTDVISALHGYAAEHGHARVPQRHVTEDGFALGKWVNRQRNNYRDGKMSDDRVALLEAVPGWSWTGRADDWEDSFAAVVAYQKANDRLPYRRSPDKETRRLAEWVGFQRRLHRHGNLDKAKVNRLTAIPGWSWGTASGSGSYVAPMPVPGHRRRAFDDLFVIDVHGAGASWRDEPLARLVVPAGSLITTVVDTFLEAITFDEEHLWQVRTPNVNLGERRVPRGVWTAPDTWLHFEAPSHFEHGDPSLAYGLTPKHANRHSWNEVAAHGDEAWLLFDYGDHWTFRIRTYDLNGGGAAAKAARVRLDTKRGALTAITQGPYVVFRTKIKQYETYEDED